MAMFSVNGFAFTPSTTTLAAPVASAIAAGPAALGNLPAQSVAPALASNGIGSAITRPLPGKGASSAAQNTSNALLSRYEASAAASTAPAEDGFTSSLFLTQALAQDGDAEHPLLLTYQTMQEFSQTKYKPSDATLPPPPQSPLSTYLQQLSENAPQPSETLSPPDAIHPSDAPLQEQAAETLPAQMAYIASAPQPAVLPPPVIRTNAYQATARLGTLPEEPESDASPQTPPPLSLDA